MYATAIVVLMNRRELGAGEHVGELVEQRRAGDQLEALVGPRGEDLPRWAG
jgi:hypothetical protein